MKIKILIIVLLAGWGCERKYVADPATLTDANLLHRNTQQLTEVIIYDVFSPPVASRIYAYTSLAAYEAIRHEDPEAMSITSQLRGFSPMPLPEQDKKYNFLLAATRAFFAVASKVTFSVDSLKEYEERVYRDFQSLLDEDTYQRSMKFGEAIGERVLERSSLDNYKKTRGMPKFLGSKDPGKWQPTAPDYLDGTEPFWNLITPLCMDSASHFRPASPYRYDRDSLSDFYKQAYEVYITGKNLTEEQKLIAKYWDDNPFVMEHSGHLMFGNKKITPVGHWMGIANIACRKTQADAVKTAQVYALTAIAIFDAFISCFDEKYRSNLVRPITVINELIDKNWQPYLQTPAFPEHTSGHSSISAAAATVLTKFFGENFAFEDTSDLQYIGLKRDFSSFMQAAREASISRLYGGIHYRFGVEEGTRQGIRIGDYVYNSIDLRK